MGSQVREIPPEIAERFSEFFPDHEDLELEDVLQEQEFVYQSIQLIGRSNRLSASSNDQISDSRQLTGNGVQISRSGSTDSELSKALALSLEYGVGDFESAGTAAGNRGSSSTETSVEAVSEDDVDPDNMTHEELLALTDAIGNESKGLAKELISSLPSHKFKDKSWWFASKKSKSPECVICFMEYKLGEWLTTLPCTHRYHRKCINRWLGDHKTCPICNDEIFE